MDEKLYELMDWAGVEAIVYSEEDHPQNLLGAHVTEAGITIQGFFPGAATVVVRVEDGKKRRSIRWTWKMKQDITQY